MQRGGSLWAEGAWYPLAALPGARCFANRGSGIACAFRGSFELGQMCDVSRAASEARKLGTSIAADVSAANRLRDLITLFAGQRRYDIVVLAASVVDVAHVGHTSHLVIARHAPRTVELDDLILPPFPGRTVTVNVVLRGKSAMRLLQGGHR